MQKQTENSLVVMENEITESDLSFMSSMVNSDDVKQEQSTPILKINLEDDCAIQRGGWVVGQKTGENGEIIDDGIEVIGFAPIVVRDSYSLYDVDNPKNNCNSQIFLRNKEVPYGNKLKIECGKGCAYRAEGAKPRCRMKKVAIGAAFTKENKIIQCLAYIGGESYIPFCDYLKLASTTVYNGITYRVPTYSSMCILGSTKVKKRGVADYFVAKFEKGGNLTKPVFLKLNAMREGIYFYLKEQEDIHLSFLKNREETIGDSFINMNNNQKSIEQAIDDELF